MSEQTTSGAMQNEYEEMSDGEFERMRESFLRRNDYRRPRNNIFMNGETANEFRRILVQQYGFDKRDIKNFVIHNSIQQTSIISQKYNQNDNSNHNSNNANILKENKSVINSQNKKINNDNDNHNNVNDNKKENNKTKNKNKNKDWKKF